MFRFNGLNLCKDFVRFGIAVIILGIGHPYLALAFLTFIDVTFN